MTARNKLNLWMAEDVDERNALSPASGLQTGDFCLVDGVNLYVCESFTDTGGVWRPHAGVPTYGRYALGGKNLAEGPSSLFAMVGCTFRAVLDEEPSSIELSPEFTANWSAFDVTGPHPVLAGVHGFYLYGTSDVIGPGFDAWNAGRYKINYP